MPCQQSAVVVPGDDDMSPTGKSRQVAIIDFDHADPARHSIAPYRLPWEQAESLRI